MSNTLLTTKVFDEMKTKQVETKKDKFFGLGFEIYDLGSDGIALSHGGSDKGVNTIVFYSIISCSCFIISNNHSFSIFLFIPDITCIFHI